eukprot:comp12190_c0_seq1/m.6954 comp12190_c0_seq1/g.6954  ORF comp12190_c0_seq1/g.6954 comp12190_c0_seq1/m.6954 type:complete len:301 (-) comp12190_c0_seq1:106-1008(-)
MEVAETLLQQLDSLLRKLGDQLESWTAHHTVGQPKWWFRSPYQHVLELALFSWVLLALSVAWYFTTHKHRPPMPPGARRAMDIFMGLSCVACTCFHLYSKLSKGWQHLAWFVMPCHVLTYSYAYVLLTQHGVFRRKVFNLCLYCGWFPVMAMLFPDFDDHVFRFEGPLYIFHHIVLIVAPIYCLSRTDRFELQPLNVRYALEMTIAVTFLNTHIQQIASYLSGLNINYHMSPPNLPLDLLSEDKWYRFKVAVLLFFLGISSRMIIPPSAWMIVGKPEKYSEEGKQNGKVEGSKKKSRKID